MKKTLKDFLIEFGTPRPSTKLPDFPASVIGGTISKSRVDCPKCGHHHNKSNIKQHYSVCKGARCSVKDSRASSKRQQSNLSKNRFADQKSSRRSSGDYKTLAKK